MTDQRNLFLGIKGHVVCIRKTDGQEVWRTKLINDPITTVFVKEKEIYATSKGRLFALNANTGDIIWENQLPGLGHGVCIIGAD